VLIYFMAQDNLSDGILYMVKSEMWSSHSSECWDYSLLWSDALYFAWHSKLHGVTNHWT